MNDRRRSEPFRVAGTLALAAVVLAACDDESRRRTNTHWTVETSFDAGTARAMDVFEPPLDGGPGVIQSEPRDIGTSLCPGVRLYRIDRHAANAPPGAPALTPRFFGRGEYGRAMSFLNVLLCELRIMHWVQKPRDEGAYLIMWRGPFIFEPEGDCDWREPFHTERVPEGRLLHFHEHCRRRSEPGPTDRPITIEVPDDYSNLFER